MMMEVDKISLVFFGYFDGLIESKDLGGELHISSAPSKRCDRSDRIRVELFLFKGTYDWLDNIIMTAIKDRRFQEFVCAVSAAEETGKFIQIDVNVNDLIEASIGQDTIYELNKCKFGLSIRVFD